MILLKKKKTTTVKTDNKGTFEQTMKTDYFCIFCYEFVSWS